MLLVTIGTTLVGAALLYIVFKRSNDMKHRAERAEEKVKAYAIRLKERILAEEALRKELVESQDFKEALKGVRNDKEAIVLVDDFFTRVGRL